MLWIWFIFIASAGVVLISGIKLSRYGEAIAVNTKLGGLWVGSIILAGATSLPEMVTAISSGVLNLPNIALGNVFGSNIFNMFTIFIGDLAYRGGPILSMGSSLHAVTALFGLVLSGVVILGLSYRLKKQYAGVGVDSIMIIVIYLIVAYILFQRQTL